MKDKASFIRLEIQETKNNLDHDLVELEHRLKSRVEGAKQIVEQKIDEVKDGARKFSPVYQVQEHPLLMVGGAITTGVVLGKLLGSKPRSTSGSFAKEVSPVEPGDSRFPSNPSPKSDSVLMHLLPEMKTLRNIALQAAIVFAGRKAKEALPGKYNEDIDMITNGVIGKIHSL